MTKASRRHEIMASSLQLHNFQHNISEIYYCSDYVRSFVLSFARSFNGTFFQTFIYARFFLSFHALLPEFLASCSFCVRKLKHKFPSKCFCRQSSAGSKVHCLAFAFACLARPRHHCVWNIRLMLGKRSRSSSFSK